MSSPIILEVFPNTGHQYFEIPLQELLPKKSSRELDQWAARHESEPWRQWGPEFPFIRYRYSREKNADPKKPDLVPYITIVVESNLGVQSRGQLFSVKENAAPAQSEQIGAYGATDENQIEEYYGRERNIPLTNLPNKDGAHVMLENLFVHFIERLGQDPIDVDLVVDFGNTRTVALLLEVPRKLDPARASFGSRVRVLKVIPWGTAYKQEQKDCEIIDSWLVVHQGVFADFEPPLSEEFFANIFEASKSGYKLRRYVSQTFTELSPAMIGGGKSEKGAAAKLAQLDLQKAQLGLFYLSSPKRYVWDNEPTGERGDPFWSQLKNRYDPTYRLGFFAPLRGLVRYYMDPDGADWPINREATDKEATNRFADRHPKYPRSSAVTWFGLSLIEAAYRQINSRKYLMASGADGIPRRLRKIFVTYPTGWACEAKENYFAQWQRAINLFTLTHFSTENHGPIDVSNPRCPGSRPLLMETDMDEAICSQLPVLYSDLQGLLHDPRRWCELYGSDGKVVVMNLDIGGGTSDLAIIEYSLKEREGRASLVPKLLFRDGKSIAGDMLVKQVTERVLVPAWIKAGGTDKFDSFPGSLTEVLKFLKNPSHPEFIDLEPSGRLRMVRVIRLLFIPLVNELLGRLTEMEGKGDAAWEPLDIEKSLHQTQTLAELNQMIGNIIRRRCSRFREDDEWQDEVFPSKGIFLNCNREEIEQCVEDVFKKLFNSLGIIAGFFKCHLVVVSGKPSELPRVRSLLIESLPVLPQRILHMKNFPAGTWYPFSSFGIGGAETELSSGRITDAKTCTVVGAALFLDQINKAPEGLPLEESRRQELSGRYYWGVISRMGLPHQFYSPPNLLFSRGDYAQIPSGNRSAQELWCQKEVTLPLNCRIGRQIIRMDNVEPEPIYILRWRPRTAVPNSLSTPMARVTLKWKVQANRGESLELVDVQSVPGHVAVTKDEVTLELNTLMEESFWLDDPKLDVKGVV